MKLITCPHSNALGKNGWNYTSTPPYDFMVCTGTDLLVLHRNVYREYRMGHKMSVILCFVKCLLNYARGELKVRATVTCRLSLLMLLGFWDVSRSSSWAD